MIAYVADCTSAMREAAPVASSGSVKNCNRLNSPVLFLLKKSACSCVDLLNYIVGKPFKFQSRSEAFVRGWFKMLNESIVDHSFVLQIAVKSNHSIPQENYQRPISLSES
jgi:hypothetical protein